MKMHLAELNIARLAEALERLELRRRKGDSDAAFGWEWLKADTQGPV